jgi:UDP-N-acetylmuramoyl-tripeptide--D-alanyl-D-alanine ligase
MFSLYSWRYPIQLLRLFAAHNYRVCKYLYAFWHTNDFSKKIPLGGARQVPWWAALALYACIVAQVAVGVVSIWLWYDEGLIGGLAFGAALVISYPIVWAHLVTVPVVIWRALHPKATGKAILTALLSAQVVRLRKRRRFKVVAVAGSVGKTSTKIAIARMLGATRQVQWQEGNYNDPVTVPLIFFGHNEPAIFNVFAWARILLANERMIARPYPYQFVVAELGTDTPGTIEQFAYLRPDLVVVTAVTAEHMEYFGDLDGVAREELAVFAYGKRVLVNMDDTPAQYLEGKHYTTYGLSPKATYYAGGRKHTGLSGQKLTFYLGKTFSVATQIKLLGDQGAKVAVAAVAAADLLGFSKPDIEAGIGTLAAFAGRMQVLPGIKNSTLIDDTYNASPVAAKAALDVLYAGKAPQRIAILGSMNELGDYSPEAHTEVGTYCNPAKLDLVVTIGPDARQYLAPAAVAQGCTVKTFLSPHEAGRFVRGKLAEGAVVLAKGSQNRVFAEEALKELLADPADARQLVRQSKYWRAVKAKQFKP